MISEQEIRELIRCYLDGNTSDSQLQQLEELFADKTYEYLLKDLLQEAYTDVKQQRTNTPIDQEIKEKIFENIVRIYSIHRKPALNRRLTWSLAVAAVVLVAIITVIFPLSNKKKQTLGSSLLLPPGANKVYLTLSNGKRISLTDSANGIIAQQAGITIKKIASGEVVYETNQGQNSKNANRVNTIETPIGAQFQVKLPDGTMVWMNAATRLKYPVTFADNQRKVELIGEAYFEVTKDNQHPFVVTSGQQVVKVLGTHFNICAYTDDYVSKTTLFEGAVQVNNLYKDEQILKPGKQAIIIKGAKDIQTEEVDVNDAIAWKEGYFLFNNDNLGVVMASLSRWYNVKFIFEDESLKNETVYVKLSRCQDLNSILLLLEKTDKVKFNAKGNTITIGRK